MRGIIICTALILLSACSKKPELPPQASSQTQTVAVPTPTLRLRHLAPEGVYFLLTRVSITNENGVIGINPGTKVTMLKPSEHLLQVTDGENKFDVYSTQLTNDIDIANNLTQKDCASQSSLKAKLVIQQVGLGLDKPIKQSFLASLYTKITVSLSLYTLKMKSAFIDLKRRIPYFNEASSITDQVVSVIDRNLNPSHKSTTPLKTGSLKKLEPGCLNKQ